MKTIGLNSTLTGNNDADSLALSVRSFRRDHPELDGVALNERWFDDDSTVIFVDVPDDFDADADGE